VYQHNQTDLEFLRTRAARIGFEILVEDGMLRFLPAPAPGSDPTVTLGTLQNLRLTSSQAVKDVTVHGWDPVRKQVIVGSAVQDTAPDGVSLIEDHGDDSTEDPLLADGLVFSQAEADAVARAALRERTLASQTVEGDTTGDPALHAGLLVQVTGAGGRFNGKYLVSGCTHRFESKGGAYRTRVRLARAGS